MPRRRGTMVLLAGALAIGACSPDNGVGTESSDTFGASTDAAPAPTDATDATDPTGPPATEPEVTATEAPPASGPGEPPGTDTDPPPTPPADDAATRASLDWERCDAGPAQIGDFECATLTVPLDHADPDGETIDIAVARLDTAAEGDQIGSLVFNPGGPGGSGIEFLTQAAVLVPGEVQRRFDLVGFDPRGVGASTAVECDEDLDDEVTLLEEGDDEAWEDLLADAAASVEECTADTLRIAPYVGTNNAARDLDLLRAALGDDGLTYVGYSYGTRLGATYAALFPDRVRALVLDAAVKPTNDLSELDRGQAEGFDRALTNFATACDADPDCFLQEIGPTLDVFDGLRAEIAEVGSFPTDDPDRVLTPAEFELGVLAALYSRDAWPFLAQGLFLAETEQDGSLLQVLGDQLVGRRPDGTYDNSSAANGFINCADDPNRPPADQVRADVAEAAGRSEYFDDLLRASTGCLFAPDPVDPLIVDPAAGAPPLLVLGNTGDPATPYEWSVELAEFLDAAVLYTVEAEGHTAYGTIDCVADVVNAYLIDLVVPGEGESCDDNAGADFFPPEGDSEIGLVIRLFDCLRENGLDVPELTEADVLADPTGEELGRYLDPTDPDVQRAVLACADILAEL